MASPLGVRFWGTRGLVSAPGKENLKYGGNTPCIQILPGEPAILVDAGFGISNYGEAHLLGNHQGPIHIFFTHMHWDHIQGLPFFHPIYSPDTELHLYSPLTGSQLRESLDILFDGSYSPFEGIDSMPAQLIFHQLNGQASIGTLTIDSIKVNHGDHHNEHADTWGYRFTRNESSVTIITDHEAEENGCNQAVIDFCANTDILVHDAQYTESEYSQFRGWGHSTAGMAINNALKSGSKKLLLTHHDPSRTDVQLDELADELPSTPMTVEYAQEGRDYWAATSTVNDEKAG